MHLDILDEFVRFHEGEDIQDSSWVSFPVEFSTGKTCPTRATKF